MPPAPAVNFVTTCATRNRRSGAARGGAAGMAVPARAIARVTSRHAWYRDGRSKPVQQLRGAARAQGLVVVVASFAVVADRQCLDSELDLEDAVGERVLRHESELRPDLLERHAVVGLLRRAGLYVHRRTGHELTDQLAHLAEGAVLALVADVEDLPARGVRRCLQAGDDRVGTVFDVDERAPLGSAEDRDRALTNRFGREEIHDEVEAGPRREPVEGPEAQRGGAEDIGRG